MLHIIWYILMGGAVGWIATQLFRGKDYGFLSNVIIGILGGVIGGFAFKLIGLQRTNIIGELITAVIGAGILLWLVDRIKKN